MPFRFSHVCQLLTDLESVVTHDPPYLTKTRDEELKRKIEYWFRCHRKAIDLGEVDGVALLSTLLPEKRADRVYGLQEARLCKVIARCLRLNKANTKILQDWKKSGHGGLGGCVQRILKELDCERKPGPPVTIEELDMTLHTLASRCRFSDPAVRLNDASTSVDELIGQLFRRLNSVEAKWLTRLILKNFSPVEINYDQVIFEFHFLLPGLLRFQDSFTAAVAQLRTSFAHYPSKPNNDIQRAAWTAASTLFSPVIGVKVGRQTFVKARSMQHCITLCGTQAWSVERKYDGEFCEVHIDLSKGENCIQIFSKSSKDSTADRHALHATLKECLRIGTRRCAFQNQCILVGEVVVWSDAQQRILEFHHLRKHISRSGVFLGREEDSQIEPGEHLMIVFFDIISLDDEILLRKPYKERRQRLKEVVRCKAGYAITSERSILDFRQPKRAQDQLCYQFAAALVNRCEGLVLKPLDMPYFTSEGDTRENGRGYVIKLKKDYLHELGEMRDIADFAVVGASYDHKLVPKSGIRTIKYTTFHLACCVNKERSVRFKERPRFRVIGVIDANQCIPQTELQALNSYFKFHQLPTATAPFSNPEARPITFDLESERCSRTQIDSLLTEPCVVEVLGSGFVRSPNAGYYTPRHPRILKLHLDRGWQDACTFQELQEMAESQRLPAENESQEILDLLKKLQGKFQRKVERECSTPSSFRSRKLPSSFSTIHPGQHSSSPSPSSLIRQNTERTKETRVNFRTNRNGDSAKNSGVVAREILESRDDNSKEDGLRPRTPTCSMTTELSSGFVSKRPASGFWVSSVDKRQKSTKPASIVTSNAGALSPVDRNVVFRSSFSQQNFSRVRSRGSRIESCGETHKGLSSQPMAVMTPLCRNESCPLSKSMIFLSPCVQGFHWVSDTLLKWHGSKQVLSLAQWSADDNTTQQCSRALRENLTTFAHHKLVLVETNRLDATFQCVSEVKSLRVRDPVLFFDWRILEDLWAFEIEEHQAEGRVREEILERRYFGLTCWSADKVVFWHKDLVKMPTEWLDT
ncbi:uncharacterized protein PV09_02169 [Verruconis gallopava]|uniref:ATP-dependent DNA ligase family profile domain-containing protein n=1 Tax=Verruconis gallopava TaxID=253628 RepID=A0A0D2B7V4_9PEZI|nr:uncharacterized protein PV09_02169 [Verruconis gallopava]KIW07319.1 hypothetical protein PV09_02169 [Verruconis gallopava]